MKKLFGLLLLFLPLTMAAKDDVTLFAEAVCDKEVVYDGDSCVITYQLYSNTPFYKVDDPKPALTIKGCSVRRLPTYGRLSQQQVYKDNKVYYMVTWGQYMVAPSKLGTYSLPTLTFNVSLQIPQASDDPFENFFGMGAQPKIIKQTTKTKPFKIKVETKPRKTTKELMESGGGFI